MVFMFGVIVIIFIVGLLIFDGDIVFKLKDNVIYILYYRGIMYFIFFIILWLILIIFLIFMFFSGINLFYVWMWV